MNRTLHALLTLFCLIGFLHISSAFAQPEKGSVMISGTASLAHFDGDLYGSYTNFTLTPAVGYFVSPQVAVGGEMSGEIMGGNGPTTVSFLIGPGMNYYFHSSSDVFPYAGGALLINVRSNNYSGSTKTYSGNSIKLRAGLAWFVRPALALTPEVQVNFDTRQENIYSYFGSGSHKKNVHGMVYSLGMGISGLLGPHKK